MRAFLLLLPALLMAQAPAPKPAQATAGTGSAAPTTDEQKTVYSLGLSIYNSLGQFDLSPAELDLVIGAIRDAAAHKPAVDINAYGPKIQDLEQNRGSRVAGREKARSADFLTKAAAAPGAVKTDSGLVFRELKAGTGETPKATDSVKVNYRGTLIDGTEFDSSYSRNQAAEFPLRGVIRCWTEGVQKMRIGGKAQLVCPSDLAYGDQGRPGIPAGSTLVFEIELLGISATDVQ